MGSAISLLFYAVLNFIANVIKRIPGWIKKFFSGIKNLLDKGDKFE